MFEELRDYQDDPIEAMFLRLAGDRHPDKIDLGIGVFRDRHGRAPVMQAVREAERRLVERELPKSYLSPLGNPAYCDDMERLVFGDGHPVRSDGRLVSAQTPGAGSALRVGAELVRVLSPGSAVWVSEPVWTHQIEFFEAAGLGIRRYRYYDQQHSRLDFAGMLDDLATMQPGDIFLLHGCCHNPTGQDLDADEWQALTELVNETGAMPFIDIAYQGFGAGIEEDVAGLRRMAAQVPQMLLAASSSKSFGIYRERAGLLSVIVPPGDCDAHGVRRMLRDTVRRLYFMAPDHGAAVVHEILSTPELREMWRSELDTIRQRIVKMRSAFRKTLEAGNPGFDGSFIETQRGMFSCLPITPDEQLAMERQFHIYMLPPARANVAAMNERQAAIVTDAFAAIMAERASGTQRASA